MTRIDWARLFFSAEGRLGRGAFLPAVGLLLAVAVLFRVAAGGWAALLFGWIVYGLVLFCAACVLSKRLHDRGRRGWWALLVLLAAVVVWPEPDGLSDLLWCAPLAWAAFELGLRPGEPIPNRYGPPSRRSVQA